MLVAPSVLHEELFVGARGVHYLVAYVHHAKRSTVRRARFLYADTPGGSVRPRSQCQDASTDVHDCASYTAGREDAASLHRCISFEQCSEVERHPRASKSHSFRLFVQNNIPPTYQPQGRTNLVRLWNPRLIAADFPELDKGPTVGSNRPSVKLDSSRPWRRTSQKSSETVTAPVPAALFTAESLRVSAVHIELVQDRLDAVKTGSEGRIGSVVVKGQGRSVRKAVRGFA